MKHIWCIDDDKFNLFEGYVMDNYKIYDDNYIWEKCEDENYVHNLGRLKTENIFENKETALNMYKGMIGIERVKVHNKIEELKKYDETLFEKLLKL